jgi:hypothetical protein
MVLTDPDPYLNLRILYYQIKEKVNKKTIQDLFILGEYSGKVFDLVGPVEQNIVRDLSQMRKGEIQMVLSLRVDK